jgi:GNAT superfamily N-acetyltransferase
VAGFITALKTDDCVFVWQIGILEKYRSKGYSKILIDAVKDYAIKQNKNMKVSIAEENLASFNAFYKYCNNNNLPFESIGLITVNDMDGKLYCDQEVIYKITCV